MTKNEIDEVMVSDIIMYTGSSIGGLFHNKEYTVKEVTSNLLELFMPKGQKIHIDKGDHDLWVMIEAKGAAQAKKRLLKVLTNEFYALMEIDFIVEDLRGAAIGMDSLMKDFPLADKMKLLGTLSQDELDTLDIFHKIHKKGLTAKKLIQYLKKDK